MNWYSFSSTIEGIFLRAILFSRTFPDFVKFKNISRTWKNVFVVFQVFQDMWEACNSYSTEHATMDVSNMLRTGEKKPIKYRKEVSGL